jgi:hypothetical protein
MAQFRNSSFIAIGVGQGDAFFLQRDGLTILVDGGRSVQGFPGQFQRVTKRENVDILVCTHNDADHAGGVLGFLRSGLRCREVWLPASWMDRLTDLLLRPERFVDELVSNIMEIDIPREGPLSLQGLGDFYSEGMKHEGKSEGAHTEIERSREGPLSLQGLGDFYSERIMHRERNDEGYLIEIDALSTALEMAPDIFWPPYWTFANWPFAGDLWWNLQEIRQDYERFRLFLDALAAASFIRRISLAAYHSGAKIRWFEYDATSNSGGIPYLVPVNAREIVRHVRVERWSVLMCLALTRSNRQSLVFLSPAKGEEPAVLFTADSDLMFSQRIPWSDGMIITAPHHGAEANRNAYQRFTRETGNKLDVIWVRSDGRFKTRPGNSYLNAHGSRYCTLCRGSICPKQDVRLTFASGRWRPVFTRKCCCI